MRVKVGTVRRRKHKKVLKAAKGFWMTRSKRYKVAHEAVMHAGQYAFHGRKLRKRDFRKLWIKRINAALSTFDIKYSRFIKLMSDKKIILNRKVLSQIALNDPATFEKIVNTVK
jgi:large subunit ribosomal protein L20